jgi:selenide,water dikinase
VIRIDERTAAVLTVDVFTPLVDDSYAFGQVAAANSLSDIYAMGAVPLAALSIVGFPVHALPLAVMREMLRGGIEKMAEAGVPVVGGHSINDEEIKCGFAVMGTAPVNRFMTNSGAEPGDALVLTKPLGAGILAFARQIGRAPEGSEELLVSSMTALNRLAGGLLWEHDAHAATDVTGFSLMGHLAEVVRNSGVQVEIDFDRLPFFPGVDELARAEVLPGALERNREAVAASLLDLAELAPAQRSMLYSPETSGGMLVALPAERAEAYVAALRAGGVRESAVVGRVTGRHAGGHIRVVTGRAADFALVEPGPAESAQPGRPPLFAAEGAGSDRACCPAGAPPGEGGAVPQTMSASDAFADYMAAVNAPGALSPKEKKLIALALSVLSRCEPCVKINAAAARQNGASDAEVAEATELGVAFGGAPAAMFRSGLGGK